MNELAAVAIGLLGGGVAGLMGVGGGILFVPALAIFLDQSQLHAEATSLLAIIPVALVGTWRQRHYGNVRVNAALAIGLLSLLGVLAGTVVANTVPERALEVAFALLILFIAAQLVARALRWEDGQRPPDRAAATAASSPSRRADSGNS
jgi:uncharacterized membrane protein YfcA